ncbi:uncharacterized protein LOC109833165 [Asparagus officinalis]|uniref:uncharacterized protein LOC109833165 n=1 Tax=Asparagus officinalis TaxID=4686 RepID=UPI00098E1B9C|nr:uncharacterized protein LOC109833165 [Asparagus officinalis]
MKVLTGLAVSPTGVYARKSQSPNYYPILLLNKVPIHMSGDGGTLIIGDREHPMNVWKKEAAIPYMPQPLAMSTIYGWLTSNLAESFNAWIKEARYLPITQTLDNIRKKMMRMSFERREASHKWTTTFVPTVEEHLIQINEQSHCLFVIPSTTGRYEVYDFPTVEVDLNEHTCTCREWQVVGLPCKHAATAIRQNNDILYSYISHYFSVETYRKCYSFPIYPIPDDDKPHVDDENMVIRPPTTSILRGRPRTKRIPSGLNPHKELKCSRCQQYGHNRRTCRQPIAD